MCWSKSSTWRIPLDKHLGRKHTELTRLDCEALWYLHDVNNVKDLDQVQIFWWEPLMEKEHFRFLAFLVKHDLAKNIFLWYNSNFTIIPKFSEKESKEYGWAIDIFDLWKHFQKVELKASIDWYGKVDEYIRLWSKWEDVMWNIDKIKARGLPNLSISTRCTIQIDNILTYPEFLLCMISKDVHYAFSSHNFVMGPDFLCIQNLPISIKKYVHKKYEKFFKKYPIVQEKYGYYIEQILKFMDAKDMKEEVFTKYLHVTRMVDSFHKVEEDNEIIALYNKLKTT
jgi:sulfatase maturation enzyme AslB (radical SAM superfamily)